MCMPGRMKSACPKSINCSMSFGYNLKFMLHLPISETYHRPVTKYGISQSMNSSGGRCHDNARCESMWAWMTEKEQLEKEIPVFWSERSRACHDLAFAEVISCNKANLERMEQNENRHRNRQQTAIKTVGRTERREEKLL